MEADKPRLVLSNGRAWEVALTLVALEVGLPATVVFKAQVSFEHPTGQFSYSADDVAFMPQSFDGLADDLNKLAKGQLDRCALAAIGGELQLNFRAQDRRKSLVEIRVHEFQPNAEPAELVLPSSLPDTDSLERLQRSVATFATSLASWIEEEQLVQGGASTT